MPGGEFDWGGRLRKGIGGAQRFPQNGWKPFDIGRIAAPLFLFILVQSIRHTRNRTNFLKRLYLAGAVIGLSNTVHIRSIYGHCRSLCDKE